MQDDRTAGPGGAPTPAPAIGAQALGWVAFCIVVSGVLTYAYLALVARSLPQVESGWFGSYWSLALVIGFGAFLPVELELARVLHRRPAGAALPAGTLTALSGLGLVNVAALVAVGPTLVTALGGEVGFLVALLCICAVSAGQFLLRGLLLGAGRLGLHGTVLLLDSGLRLVLAAVLGLVSPGAGAAAYAWTLVAAMALAHLPLLAWLLLRRRAAQAAGAPAVERERPRSFLGAVGNLLVGTLCAQVLLNAAPVLIAVLAAPEEAGLVARFVWSYNLVRLPLFVAVPLQSALVPVLTRLQEEDGGARLRAFLVRGLVVIGGLAVVGLGVGLWLGPWLVSLLFGDGYALSGEAIAVLAVGSALHLGLLVASQALVATARHRQVAVVWMSGLLVACLVVVLVDDLVLRTALAFTLGSGVSLAVAAVTLLVAPRATPVGTASHRP